jgi:hypothetical protein
MDKHPLTDHGTMTQQPMNIYVRYQTVASGRARYSFYLIASFVRCNELSVQSFRSQANTH